MPAPSSGARVVIARGARSGSRRRRARLLPYALIAPAVLLVLGMAVFPLLYAVQISLTDANLKRMASISYVGLQNYLDALGDEIVLGSVWRTARWVSVVIGVDLLMAVPLAVFLNTRFGGRGLVRAAILLPWATPAAVAAIIYRFMVNPNFGIVNDLLVRLGVIGEYLPWMSGSWSSFAVVAYAQIWAGLPFVTITLLAGIQAIPEELYEVARVDGAGAWQRFRHITLPWLTPLILLLLLLRTIWLSQSVDLLFLMTEGGPGYDNRTLAVHSFMLTWHQLELGSPSALSIMLSIVLLGVSAIYIRLMARSQEWT
jgi:multiple sugar transport system permease protein